MCVKCVCVCVRLEALTDCHFSILINVFLTSGLLEINVALSDLMQYYIFSPNRSIFNSCMVVY